MAKFDIIFNQPILNAAGFLGFAPDPYGAIDISLLGGFFTNPVSLEPRSPAGGRRCLDYPGGVLFHTGFPNPGFRQILRRYASGWARSPLPVWVHLLVKGQEDTARMVRRLENLEGVSGVEISPPLGIDRTGVSQLIEAAQGELPVILRLPFDGFLELALEAARLGAAAISLGAPRGSLLDEANMRVDGRLYGPGLFPQALHAVREAATAGIPVIGSGGIYQRWQIQAMLEAGAFAVQLDTALWRGGLL
jgi:dihydroorotate dehydrogenase (NAD+) catalytic subunit